MGNKSLSTEEKKNPTTTATPSPTTTPTGEMDDNYIILQDGTKAKVTHYFRDIDKTDKGENRRVHTFPWPSDFCPPSRSHRIHRESLKPMLSLVHEQLSSEGIERKQFAGSIRRGCDTIGDIDMVVLSLPIKQYSDFDFWLAKPHYWGAMLLEATGSMKFNIWLRWIASKRSLKLNRYGLWHRDKSLNRPWKLGEDIQPITSMKESEIFQALNMRFIPPRDRCIRDKKTHLWSGC